MSRVESIKIDVFNGEHWTNVSGQLHRLDGPAVEYNDGHREWCINGQLHRTDGPAIEWPDGRKEWFLRGVELTPDEHRNRVTEAARSEAFYAPPTNQSEVNALSDTDFAALKLMISVRERTSAVLTETEHSLGQAGDRMGAVRSIRNRLDINLREAYNMLCAHYPHPK